MSDLGRLRAIEDGDLDTIRDWRNRPEVRDKMYTTHEISAEEHARWWTRSRQDPGRRTFIYELGGRGLGVVAFADIDAVSRRASWAMYAAPEAPPAIGWFMELAALDHAFGELALNRLQCEVLAFNRPVLALHRQFGFVEEGLLRRYHRRDEEYIDVHLLAILAEEWAAAREPLYLRLARPRPKKADPA